MSYQVSARPYSTNKNPSGTQADILAALREKFPAATFTKLPTGLWTVDIPGAVILPPLGRLLFADNFNSLPDGLITNEFAFWNPTNSAAKKSPNWAMTSGSLFAKGGRGWSGVPDDREPGLDSTGGNNSSVFRLTTVRSDYLDIAASFTLKVNKYSSSPSTPDVAWDGIHVFLRYQTEFHLYYASVNRRDKTCVIKKKMPGGTSNGGTYYEISSYVPFTPPAGDQAIMATIKTNADKSVTIAIYNAGKKILEANDNGIGGAPILFPGMTGIRGDNCDFTFDDFAVNGL